MALCHFHVGHIGRAGGQSAIASAAYRAGEELYSEYYGETNDFTRKGGVTYTEIMLPPNAPPEYKDRQTLWNAVEEVEKHKKAQLAYSFDIALQNEFTPEENLELARTFVQECLVDKGMIADLAIHEPDKGDDGIPNPHFHVMATMRPLNPDGSWGNKQRREYILDENGNRKKDENGNYVFNAVHTTDWHTPETLIWWRERWCELNNEVFESKGLDIRLDPRSYEERGIDQIPTIHEGPQVRQMEARGIPTEKGDKNRWIKATNRLIAELVSKIRSILEWIAEYKTKWVKTKDPAPVIPIVPIEKPKKQEMQKKQEVRKTENNQPEQQEPEEKSDDIRLLEEHDIHTMDDLEAYTEKISAKADDLLARSRANTARIKKLDEMIRFGGNVRKYQPLIDEMNAIRWKSQREKFKEQHSTEIDLYYTSRRILKENHGVTKFSMKEWKLEKARLVRENQDLYEQYTPLRDEVNQIMEVRRRIENAGKSKAKDKDLPDRIV